MIIKMQNSCYKNTNLSNSEKSYKKNQSIKGNDMRITEDLIHESEILQKIRKYNSYMILLDKLTTNDSTIMKIEELTRFPMKIVELNNYILPVNIYSGGLYNRWNDTIITFI
jgi:hypothetical protein